MEELALDAARAAHLAAFAGGFALAVAAQRRAAAGLFRPVTEADLRATLRAHRLIAFALAGLWITGLWLVFLRTGFGAEAMSPKLRLKIAVVGLLSLDGLLIHAFALPAYRRAVGRSLSGFRVVPRLALALLGAVSAASWSAALVLGSSGILRVAGWDLLLPAAGLHYAVFLTAGLGLAALAPAFARGPRPGSRPGRLRSLRGNPALTP